MITWKKNRKGEMRGIIDDMIVYRQRDKDMEVYSETNLEDFRLKFKFTIKR